MSRIGDDIHNVQFSFTWSIILSNGEVKQGGWSKLDHGGYAVKQVGTISNPAGPAIGQTLFFGVEVGKPGRSSAGRLIVTAAFPI